MSLGLLDGVRAHAARVVADAQHVRIELSRLAGYAESLPLDQLGQPELDPTTHYFGARDATLAYVVTLDAINFGSGYFPHLTKRAGRSGYFTVASTLKDQFEAHGAFTALALQDLSARDCARIFNQAANPDPAAGELMRLFAQALNALGNFVERHYDGAFERLVDSANGSAERLASILAGMPFYRDVGFYKRAQLTAADLSTARVADFGDLERLTIFADNLVPHVLRLDGVLTYDRALLGRIEREELIAAGSAEEREIRASALHAVELIAARLGERGQAVAPMRLDYLLWNRGQHATYKAHPRHRTRTVFY